MFLNSPYRPRKNLVKTTNPNRMKIGVIDYNTA